MSIKDKIVPIEHDDGTSTEVAIMTSQDIFQKEVKKVEDQIVDSYVNGSTIMQILERWPSYNAQQVQLLIEDRLSSKYSNPDWLIGAGNYGYNEDIKALNDFIEEEAAAGSAVKLRGIQIRAQIRDAKLKYMQSTGLIPNVNNLPTDPSKITVEYEQSKRVRKEFDLALPNDRLSIIEALENEDENGSFN